MTHTRFLATALLLSLYTLADATLTLLRRLMAGERVYAAHRTHFYQRAVAQGLRVPQVTARVFLLGLLLALLAFALAFLGLALPVLLALAFPGGGIVQRGRAAHGCREAREARFHRAAASEPSFSAIT